MRSKMGEMDGESGQVWFTKHKNEPASEEESKKNE